MSTVPKPLLTEQQYLAIERAAELKSEFFRGEMFAMAGASREHNLIAGNCFGLLWQSLSKAGCEVYQSDMKVRVGNTGLYAYPDVVVACGQKQFADEDADVLLNPTVLIEVTSPSTANYVRGFKSKSYRALPSLQEYLVIEQDQPLVEHYVRQVSNAWLVTEITGLDATVQLKSNELTLPLALIYAQVVFPTKPRLAIHRRDDFPG